MAGSINKGEQICTFIYSGYFHNCSPSWSSLLGYSQEELSSMRIENILAEGSGSKILQTIKVISEKDAPSGVIRECVDVVSGRGSNVQGLLTLEWARGERENLYGSFVYTHRAAATDKNMIYEYIAETSLFGMIEYDEYSNITFADKIFENYFGLNNLVGSKTYSFSGNPSFVAFLKSVGDAEDCACIKTGGEKLIALVEKNHGTVSIRLYNKHFLLKTSHREELSTVLNMKRIWDKLPMMLLIDAQGKVVVDANFAASDFYGYRLEEFKNMPVTNLSMLPADIIDQELILAISGKKKFFISRHRTAGGQVKDVSYSTAIISLGEKKYILTFIADITRRKSMEKVIEEKNAVLTELNLNLSKMIQDAQKEGKRKEELFLRQSKLAAVGEMVSSVADYWKEPLNTVALLVQDMEDAKKYGELDEKYIETMVKTVMGHLEAISLSIDTCTKFFKSDSEEELFDVRGAILGIVKILERRFAAAGITLCCDCSCITECLGFEANSSCSGGLIDILGHVNEFKHAVCNILINSLEAIANARKNGILLAEDEGLIFIRIKADGKTVTIAFSDNGGGVEEESAGKIFDPYFSTKDKGMGIGLYITKQLVEKKLKGGIAFENIREGAMISLSFPCSISKIIE